MAQRVPQIPAALTAPSLDARGADDAVPLADHTGVRQLPISELTRAYAAAGERDVQLHCRLFRDAD